MPPRALPTGQSASLPLTHFVAHSLPGVSPSPLPPLQRAGEVSPLLHGAGLPLAEENQLGNRGDRRLIHIVARRCAASLENLCLHEPQRNSAACSSGR